MKSKIFVTEDIEQLLRNRFCPPAYAYLPQVRNGTGYMKVTRTADAIAMSLWPSRGLHLNGFEIKVRRGDWFNELRNPQKAEEIAQYCDYFWIVAPKDIVKVEEVPKNWGFMIPHGATTKIIKDAPQLKTIPIDKLFLAAILRKAQETIVPDSKLRKARSEGYKNGKENAERSFEYEKEKHKGLKDAICEFEKKSGVRIDRWDVGSISEAVKMVLTGEHLRVKEELQELLKKSEIITKDIKETLSKEA